MLDDIATDDVAGDVVIPAAVVVSMGEGGIRVECTTLGLVTKSLDPGVLVLDSLGILVLDNLGILVSDNLGILVLNFLAVSDWHCSCDF